MDDLTTPSGDPASDLSAAEVSEAYNVEGLGAESALGTWGSASSWGSASCPASTASTVGSASSAG